MFLPFGANLEVFLETFSGTFLEPKHGTPGWLECGQAAAGCGQNAEEFGSGQEFPPFVQISYRNLCRMSCRKGLETPLAASLAASAGGLGSLEALAVHP